MLTRLIAAVVGLAIVLPAIFLGGPLALQIVVGLAGLVCLDEYARMAFPKDYAGAMVWLTAASAMLYLGMLLIGPAAIAPAVALGVLGSFSWGVFRVGERLEDGADRIGRVLLGLAWIPGTLVFLPLLRDLDNGLHWVFLLMLVPWSSDTGGYFAGRAFGRTPLAPRVSPKKTVEGLVGGLTLATIGVFVFRAYAMPSLEVLDCVVLGVGLGVVGVIGDLAESLVKRSFGVKDSGWIMPGHGGILDRIDALMFVGPLLFVWATRGQAG